MEQFFLWMNIFQDKAHHVLYTIPFPRADWLDGKHVVFGHVISGADVVRKMEKCGSKAGTTTSKVSIYACGELK